MKIFRIYIKFLGGAQDYVEYYGEDDDTPSSIQLMYQRELDSEFVDAMITNVVEV